MRKPLPLSITPEELSQVDPRWREAVEKISALQARDLTYWEEFPIELPRTTFEEAPPEELSGIFQAPTDDELDEVARGPGGSLKRLSPQQLAMLKEEGQFSVPSQRYAGQRHVWVLSALLQRGRAYIRARQRRSNAAALRQLRFKVVDRIDDDGPVSLKNSIKHISRGIFYSLDLFFGLPQRRNKHLEHGTDGILQKERTAFVLEGLTQGPTDFIFLREDRILLDLRLQDHKLMEKAWPILEKLAAEAQEEFKQRAIPRREALLTSLREQGLSTYELSSRISSMLEREQRELFFQKILESSGLTLLYLSLPQLLVNHAKAAVIISSAEQALFVELQQNEERERARLCREYPTWSLIPEWMNRELPRATAAFTRSATEASHQKIGLALEDAGLTQEAFLFSRGIAFTKEREPGIKERLSAEEVPTRTFTWRRSLWRSSNWKILEHEQIYHPDAPRFYVDRYEHSKVTTDSWLWRYTNTFWRAASFLNNGLHWLLVKNAWNGPLGLRAFFGAERFSPDLELNPHRGVLEPSRKKMPTFRSRLRTIWHDIQKSRRSFEAKPDKGIIGKSISRWINRAWNYIIKGFLGTLLVMLGQPILTLLNLALVLVLVLTSVAWAPLGSLGVMVVNILLYDFEETSSVRALPLVRRLFQASVQGVAQAGLSIFLAAVFHPLCALLFFLWGLVRTGVRAFYDDIVRWLILKRLGRVPASNGFLARRVAGPGLSSEFYFQVRPALVLLIAQANLERIELEIYQRKTKALLYAPQLELQKFTAQVFGFFSHYLEPSERVSELVNQKTAQHSEALDKTIKERTKLLNKIATIQEAERIRQTRQDLLVTLTRLRPMVQTFCEERLFLLLAPSEQDAFFVERGLSRGDFVGLTRWLLSTSISPGLLEPLEDADRSLRLLVEPLNVNRYLKALEEDTPIGDELDRVRSAEAGFSLPHLAEEILLHTSELFGQHTDSLRALLFLVVDDKDSRLGMVS